MAALDVMLRTSHHSILSFRKGTNDDFLVVAREEEKNSIFRKQAL